MLCWNSSPGMARRVPDEGILLTNIMALFIHKCSLLMTPFSAGAVQQTHLFPTHFGKQQALTLKLKALELLRLSIHFMKTTRVPWLWVPSSPFQFVSCSCYSWEGLLANTAGWPWSSSWWRVQHHPVPLTWTWGLHSAEEILSWNHELSLAVSQHPLQKYAILHREQNWAKVLQTVIKHTLYSEKESSSSCWRTPEMIHPANGCDKNRQIRHWYVLRGGWNMH